MELTEYISSVFGDFINPKKRIFLGYLLLSLLIALLWLVTVKRTNLTNALARIFDRKILFSSSSKADYKLFVFNQLITLLISPMLITQLTIGTAIYFFLHKQSLIAPSEFSSLSTSMIIGLFSVSMFVIDDFTKYLVHRWMHHWPVLWAIHKVHHSAETLTPITVYRVHPLEGVLYALRSAVAQGVAISIFVFAFGNAVDLYTILGVNVLVFVFHVTGSNLRHSHIEIRYWPWLERFLISPAQHQLHHSIAEKHYDKNFGAALAIWDWMFGSLHLSEKDEQLSFGVIGEEDAASSIGALYWRPFRDIWRLFSRRAQQAKDLVGRAVGAKL
ncbi:Sterol desaturase/sphingolipid hydroxylase, fatty acid hydroxylase superfamily [Cognatiyoonia sediminum]|uniref:Sterol desaturase/sphingolipid hydroxylase, fatty acid hydroxylase superfamily n=1 Tax=Cognatiyoonia sediminum TaxID=1508389 RepID=A0A1M5SRL2_9RHOB|nr:sterol desaturase family protein [Cognatiyoonia sediminum]SHH41136.1 Sterol desaturase/sphingolipid hydroxylase, fatty acid hydroxylase superfamily [Cognatiyoonia sediminum]